MKKLKTLFNSFTTFLPQQEMEANKKHSKPDYLKDRLARLKRLAAYAREDKNILKTLQAHRLIHNLSLKLADRTRINLPYIENKEVIN